MASRSIINYDSTSFDTMDKMPTNTLKRNTKNIDMTKAELLRLLSFLEGELQGREVTIAALKAEKSKQLLYQAKYGRFGLGDPFHALQRDSDSQRDSSFDEAAVKAMYDNQLTQLENLIETQRGAQTRMREQLAAVEKRYHKVCAELEEEKRRHAKDAEEGDNVTCLLEKERERLKQELDFEKAQNKKLEKELKKTNACSEEGKTAADKHKLVAVKLIRERNILVEKIIMLDQRNKQLEKTLQDEQDKTKEMAEGIAQESQKCHQLEANLEKALSDFDTEREQLKLKLSREENKNKELTVEVEKLKFQIEQLQRQVGQEKRLDSPKTIQIKSSPHVGSSNGSVSSAPMHRVTSPPPSAGSVSPRGQPTTASKVFKSANPASPDVRQVPVLHVRNSPDGEVSAPLIQKPQGDVHQMTKHNGHTSCDQAHDPSLEFLEPEIEDLQQILVSMATEPEEPSQSVVQVGEALVASVNSSSSIQNNQEISSNEKGPYKVLANQISEVDSKIILQKYVDGCDWLGLQEYLSSHKDTDMELQLNNGNTIGHSVAEQGQLDCLRLVLNLGLNVNSVNGLGMTILHSAVTGHQLGCVKLLLEFGADMSLKTKEHMSCLHLAAKLGFSQIFCLLLEQCLNNWPQQVTNLLQECDLGGNSVVFLAAMNTHVEMLEFISKCCEIDVKHVNRNGKTILDVASFGCLSLLQSLEKEKISCNVVVDTGPSSVNSTPSESGNNQWFVVGSISVAKDTSWQQIESLLSNVLLNHLTEVHQGLRTKKTVVKTDAESPDSQNVHFSLGVSLNSVKYFGIGIYFWSPGTPSERRPFDLLSNTQNKQITVRLFGTDDGCLDNLSYESLIPHQQLQNYLRLMEQYKSVILYGATGSGKTFLCRKLAQIIQSKEGQLGRVSELNFVSVHDKFTKNDLHSVLHKTGCLLHCTQSMSQNYTSMVILDGLEKCNVADLFSDIAGIIDCRGPAATLPLAFDNKPSQNYYLHSNCFILGTMDTLRLPVMELSIQQSFRWVQFRNDQEPMRYLLHRQLYRQLLHQYRGTMPSPEEPVFKAVEWIISVWHRLNEGIMKLALQDHILGPAAFLSCPIEIGMPKTILRWLNMLWNQKIAPAVSDAVVKGSGSDTVAGGQQKVANTALYVLMQRSIVSGCPLVGQEKERYMSGFQGSNELDIRMRKERIKTSQPSTPTSETKVDIEADLDLIKHGSDTTGWTDSGHSPDIHSPHGKQGFYNTGRNPLQKSASLPSNNIGQHSPRAAGTPMSPQLNRSGLSPHPQPFTLSPKVVNTTEPPKSFGSSMFALSGVPVSKQEQVRNNVRSNSVSATSSPQFSRTILAGSPLPNQSGSRSATQSPAFQGGQLSLPTHSHSISSPEILANNNLVGNARLGPSDNRSVSSQKTGNHIMQQYPLSPTLQNSFNTSLPQSKTNKNLRAQTMSPVSKFISGPNLTAHQQTVLQGGVNVGNGTNSAKGLDTSNLRRAFSPTPQQFPGRGDLQKPDVLRRSFSPSPDMLFSRRTGDQGVLPLTLPKK